MLQHWWKSFLKQNKTTHFHFFIEWDTTGYIFAPIAQQTCTVHEMKIKNQDSKNKKSTKIFNKCILCLNFTSVHFHSSNDTRLMIQYLCIVIWSLQKKIESLLKGKKINITNCLYQALKTSLTGRFLKKNSFHAILMFTKTHISNLHMENGICKFCTE